MSILACNPGSRPIRSRGLRTQQRLACKRLRAHGRNHPFRTNKTCSGREHEGQDWIEMDAAASHRSIGPAALGSVKQEGFGRQEMTIKADLSRLAEVRRFTDAACRAYGFPPDVCYQIKLAMSEAVANAIEHGSTTPDD